MNNDNRIPKVCPVIYDPLAASSGYYEYKKGVRSRVGFGDYGSALQLLGPDADIRYVMRLPLATKPYIMEVKKTEN